MLVHLASGARCGARLVAFPSLVALALWRNPAGLRGGELRSPLAAYLKNHTNDVEAGQKLRGVVDC